MLVSLFAVSIRPVQLHKDGKRQEAATLYRQCLDLDPSQARIWSNYGALLREEKYFQASVGALRRAQELEPDQISVRSNLANALYNLGAFPDAMELRRQLVAENPDDVEQIR